MAMATAPHIKRDDRGVAWEEIHFQHPGLSLAQIYAALTYYYDNQGGARQRDRPSGFSVHVPRAITDGLRVRRVDVLTAQGGWIRSADSVRASRLPE